MKVIIIGRISNLELDLKQTLINKFFGLLRRELKDENKNIETFMKYSLGSPGPYDIKQPDGIIPAPLMTAVSEIGTQEIPGPKHNNRILEYFKASGRDDIVSDEVPWCSAFIAYCFHRWNYKFDTTLMARSWLSFGLPVDEPIIGDLLIFYRGNKNDGVSGHVGFYFGKTKKQYLVLGGNQSNEVNVTFYPVKNLLGIRRPEYY